MNPGKLAQARRFYHHVYNGGTLKPEDVSYMVAALEKAHNEIEIAKNALIALNYPENPDILIVESALESLE